MCLSLFTGNLSHRYHHHYHHYHCRNWWYTTLWAKKNYATFFCAWWCIVPMNCSEQDDADADVDKALTSQQMTSSTSLNNLQVSLS